MPQDSTMHIDTDTAKTSPVETVLQRLGVSEAGLSDEEAQRRLIQYGPNALEEHRISPVMKFLSYFWGPIPWMIEIAAVLFARAVHKRNTPASRPAEHYTPRTVPFHPNFPFTWEFHTFFGKNKISLPLRRSFFWELRYRTGMVNVS